MKTVVFEGYDLDRKEPIRETREYESDATFDEIQKDYEQWVWELIGDYFSWDEV